MEWPCFSGSVMDAMRRSSCGRMMGGSVSLKVVREKINGGRKKGDAIDAHR